MAKRPKKKVRKGQAKAPAKVTWAEAVRDVLIASMTKGLLVPLLVGGALILLIFRAPEQEAGNVLKQLVGGLQDWSLVGWVLFGATLIGWIAHARIQRKSFHREMDRVARERNRLQRKASDRDLKSSRES